MLRILIATIVSVFLLNSIQTFAHEEEGVITIHMDESRFEPNNISIEVGTKVIFENIGKKPHWPASNIHPTHGIYPEFDSKGGVSPGEEWSFVFDTPGIWRMHDHLQAEISGVITVTGSSSIETIDEEVGLWSKIKKFFISLFKSKKKTEENSNIESLIYNKDIGKESDTIWRDDNELFSYLKKYGVKQTYIQLDSLGKQGFGDCHQVAHRAGRMSLNIFGTSALKECSLVCHSGCYHGITEAYFKKIGSNNLKENLNNICADTKSKLFHYSNCVHGVGHGLLSWTNYEVPEALEMCDLLSENKKSCFTGVFMENVITEPVGEGKDEHVTKYKSDDPQFPCTIVNEKYKGSCYSFQTSRMVQIFRSDFKKVAEECLKVPEKYRNACFTSMGRDISGHYRLTPDRSIQECNHSPKKYKSLCLNGAAQDALWDISGSDNSIKFCTLITDTDEKKSCYETIIDRMNLIVKDKSEKNIFCSKVEKEFEEQCRLEK